MNDIYAGRDCPCGQPMTVHGTEHVCAVYGRQHPIMRAPIRARKRLDQDRAKPRRKEAI